MLTRLLLAATVFGTSPVLAQTGAMPPAATPPAAMSPAAMSPPAMSPAAMSPAAMGMAPPALAQAQSGPQVEQQITDLRKRLAITVAQEPQWTAFASVMRQNAAHMSQLMAGRRAQVGTQKAPEELRAYAEIARAHSDDLARLASPFDALYGTMSAEQQALTDRTFSRPPGRGRRG